MRDKFTAISNLLLMHAIWFATVVDSDT